MSMHTKPIAALSALVLLGLSATANAEADSARVDLRTRTEVQACIDEIAKRADYAGAERVVHTVRELKQKNLVEVELMIVTTVYADQTGSAARAYETSCVIAQLGKVVEVHTARSEPGLVSAR